MLHHGHYIILASKFVIPHLWDVFITTEMTQMVVRGARVQPSFIGIPNWRLVFVWRENTSKFILNFAIHFRRHEMVRCRLTWISKQPSIITRFLVKTGGATGEEDHPFIGASRWFLPCVWGWRPIITLSLWIHLRKLNSCKIFSMFAIRELCHQGKC